MLTEAFGAGFKAGNIPRLKSKCPMRNSVTKQTWDVRLILLSVQTNATNAASHAKCKSFSIWEGAGALKKSKKISKNTNSLFAH